jgi:hypothetical protein
MPCGFSHHVAQKVRWRAENGLQLHEHYISAWAKDKRPHCLSHTNELLPLRTILAIGPSTGSFVIPQTITITVHAGTP